jgi:hypothetical protein
MSNYSIICIIIGIITVFSSNISMLSVIIGIFSGNNAIIRRDITHLGQNVVLLGSCKQHQIQLITQRFQLFEWELAILPCPIYRQLSTCILLIELYRYIHSHYRHKNKPIQNIGGV